jgi:hypothetical protein
MLIYDKGLLYLKTDASFAGWARNRYACPIRGIEPGASNGLASSPESRPKARIVLKRNKNIIGKHSKFERSESRRCSIRAEKIKAAILNCQHLEVYSAMIGKK